MALTLSSSAFDPSDPIPRRYTCDGAGVSPPLAWSGVPERAASLVLVVEDPDAPRGTLVHWLLYNLPPTAGTLPEGVTAQQLPAGSHQGENSRGEAGYTPPCPPSARHRYVFRLSALDRTPEPLSGTLAKEAVESAMPGHVLEQAELIGTYQRAG